MTKNTSIRRERLEPVEGVDLDEAAEFLAALDTKADVFCLHTFDDSPDRKLRNQKLAGCDTGTLDECKDWLIRTNKRYEGAFVAINPTDGLGRTKKNVTGVRAIMLDLDGKPVEPVHECALKPHIIIETSAGHYQYCGGSMGCRSNSLRTCSVG